MNPNKDQQDNNTKSNADKGSRAAQGHEGHQHKSTGLNTDKKDSGQKGKQSKGSCCN